MWHFQAKDIPEVCGQGDVLETDTATEERSYFSGGIACNAAADTGNEEALLLVLCGIVFMGFLW